MTLSRTKKQLQPIEAAMESRLRDLMPKAAEYGAEAGLHGLSDNFEEKVDSELRCLSTKFYGEWGPTLSVLLDQERELERLRQDADEKIRSYRMRHVAEHPPEPQSNAKPIASWHTGLNAAACSILPGMGLEAYGVELGWRGWLCLSLLVIFLIVNHRSLQAWARRLSQSTRDFLEHRRAVSESKRLSSQISTLRMERMERAKYQSRAEEWVARNKAALIAEYQFHKIRGQRAAELVSQS